MESRLPDPGGPGATEMAESGDKTAYEGGLLKLKS